MPGFDKSRFKNLTKNESESLTCGICLGILCNPNITKCCGQAYCHDCIEEWLKSSKTCPNDRKRITNNQMLPAPLLVKNMLNNLLITCQYLNIGCVEVKTIEQIEQHEHNCEFNPEAICIDCLSKNGNYSGHDCIDNLKSKYKEICFSNSKLSREIKILNNQLVLNKLYSNNELNLLNKKVEENLKNKNILENKIKELKLSNVSLANSRLQQIELNKSNQKLIIEFKSSKEQTILEISRLNQQIKEINSDLLRKTNYEQILVNKIKILEQKLNESSQKIESQHSNLKESHVQFDESKKQQDTLNAYIQDLKKDNEKLKAEIRKNELESIAHLFEKTNLSQKITQLEYLRDDLEKSKLEILQNRKELKRLNFSNKQFIDILEIKDKDIRKLKQMINSLNTEIKDLSNVLLMKFQ